MLKFKVETTELERSTVPRLDRFSRSLSSVQVVPVSFDLSNISDRCSASFSCAKSRSSVERGRYYVMPYMQRLRQPLEAHCDGVEILCGSSTFNALQLCNTPDSAPSVNSLLSYFILTLLINKINICSTDLLH